VNIQCFQITFTQNHICFNCGYPYHCILRFGYLDEYHQNVYFALTFINKIFSSILGILLELKTRWFHNACEDFHSGNSISKFSLIFFSTLFMVLSGAIVLAVFCFGIEVLVKRYRKKSHKYEQVHLIKATPKTEDKKT